MTSQYVQPLDMLGINRFYNYFQNDMLAWLMDQARGDEKCLRNLTLRVLVVNFAAIHTTSMVPHAFFSCPPSYLK
jgi:hypothetical protein